MLVQVRVVGRCTPVDSPVMQQFDPPGGLQQLVLGQLAGSIALLQQPTALGHLGHQQVVPALRHGRLLLLLQNSGAPSRQAPAEGPVDSRTDNGSNSIQAFLMMVSII